MPDFVRLAFAGFNEAPAKSGGDSPPVEPVAAPEPGFNEAPAKSGGDSGDHARRGRLRRASMRPPQKAGGIPTDVEIASMRPPQKAGGISALEYADCKPGTAMQRERLRPCCGAASTTDARERSVARNDLIVKERANFERS